MFTKPVRRYYDAARTALASTEPVMRDPEHDDAARAFLFSFARELHEREPWPEPAVQQLVAERWSAVAAVPVIARLDLSQLEVSERMNRLFRTTQSDGGPVSVLLLALRTGERVSLVAPDSVARRGIDLRSDAEPARTLEHLTELTGIPMSAT